MSRTAPLALSLFGAPSDTSNLGLSALSDGLLSVLFARRPQARVTVFDNGLGARTAVHEATGVPYCLQGARLSRRLDRPEKLSRIGLALRLGGRGSAAATTLLESVAVLDVSGGDSFGDLYGAKRFAAVSAPKRLAIQRGVPLVLLPQTYGPFRDPAVREEAARLTRGATAAWARDAESFTAMRELLGDAFDPERHREGVDLAFALEPRRPGDLPSDLGAWLDHRGDVPLVGLNVSGLVFNDPAAGSSYGLSIDYGVVVRLLLCRLLDAGARVVLVPHVLLSAGVESDLQALAVLRSELTPAQAERVLIAPSLSASGAKWLIGQMDWFTGTRMHATIAGLSSGVPTDAIAYSLKFSGVFASAAQESRVHEARTLGSHELVERLVNGFERRERTRAELTSALPRLQERVSGQADDLVRVCDQLATT